MRTDAFGERGGDVPALRVARTTFRVAGLANERFEVKARWCWPIADFEKSGGVHGFRKGTSNNDCDGLAVIEHVCVLKKLDISSCLYPRRVEWREDGEDSRSA